MGGTVRIWAPGGRRARRVLDVEELSEVAANVPHLGGGVEVLRHYLPGLLEIDEVRASGGPDADFVTIEALRQLVCAHTVG